jgi:hypothetical protein
MLSAFNNNDDDDKIGIQVMNLTDSLGDVAIWVWNDHFDNYSH